MGRRKKGSTDLSSTMKQASIIRSARNALSNTIPSTTTGTAFSHGNPITTLKKPMLQNDVADGFEQPRPKRQTQVHCRIDKIRSDLLRLVSMGQSEQVWRKRRGGKLS